MLVSGNLLVQKCSKSQKINRETLITNARQWSTYLPIGQHFGCRLCFQFTLSEHMIPATWNQQTLGRGGTGQQLWQNKFHFVFVWTEVDCGAPVVDGTMTAHHQATILNSILNLTCVQGYVFNNTDTSLTVVQMRCTESATWDHVNTGQVYNTCERKRRLVISCLACIYTKRNFVAKACFAIHTRDLDSKIRLKKHQQTSIWSHRWCHIDEQESVSGFSHWLRCPSRHRECHKRFRRHDTECCRDVHVCYWLPIQH